MKNLIKITMTFILLLPFVAQADLDIDDLVEASGMAVSKQFPNRFYHHNDGDDSTIFVTDKKGDLIETTRMVRGDYSFIDFEDMALGPCADKGQCLYLADIGDNDKDREDIQIYLMREKAEFSKNTEYVVNISAYYPDGAHNAEAFAVAPNGDIYVMTKKTNKAALYKIPFSKWKKNHETVLFEMQLVKKFNFKKILDAKGRKTLVTGMDISPDGKRLAVITYGDAVEFDLKTFESTVYDLDRLDQQEAIAYSKNGKYLYYSTETEKNGNDFEILKVRTK